jgi:hypothetical protein
MGFVAGALGGMVGAVAMNTLGQAARRRASLDDGSGSGTPLTQNIVYAGFCGGVYGTLAEYLPNICCAFGTPFGISLAVGAAAAGLPTVEAAVDPEHPTAMHHVIRLSTHAAFGGATEIIRRTLRRA